MNTDDVILIVANSGRMLAQFLSAVGFSVVVVDCYADKDMQSSAQDWLKVSALRPGEVRTAFQQLAQRNRLSYVIYGSGLESYPETLAFLEKSLPVLGNNYSAFTDVLDKAAFFSLLESLSIDHPEVSFVTPGNSDGWLVKSFYGEGGAHIKKASANNQAGGYWQRLVEGQPMSVLFVAGKDKIEIAGFHRQFCENNNDYPFLFSGVSGEVRFSEKFQRLVTGWVEKLARHYQLRGLNSLDFIFDGHNCYVLEINARPSASLQLYEKKLIFSHIQTCLGNQPEIIYNSNNFAAYKVVYAPFDLRVKNSHWPDWALDCPVPFTRIKKGEPLCSIVEPFPTSKPLDDNLEKKQQQIVELMTDRY